MKSKKIEQAVTNKVEDYFYGANHPRPAHEDVSDERRRRAARILSGVSSGVMSAASVQNAKDDYEYDF